jgi:hypothetical protein
VDWGDISWQETPEFSREGETAAEDEGSRPSKVQAFLMGARPGGQAGRHHRVVGWGLVKLALGPSLTTNEGDQF